MDTGSLPDRQYRILTGGGRGMERLFHPLKHDGERNRNQTQNSRLKPFSAF